jgi:hypothetical protein
MAEAARHALFELSTSELSGPERVSLIWGFWWRGISVVFASAAIGGFLGYLPDILRALTVPSEATLRILAFAIGMGIGSLLFIPCLGWLLRARFRGIRLALVRQA